jgi:arginyl-tRNA synthetase
MNYSYEKAKNELKKILQQYFKTVDIEIEIPPENINADFAVPLFKIAKKYKKNPELIALELIDKINLKNTLFTKVERTGSYINFYLDNTKFIQSVFSDYKNASNYGSSNFGKGKTILIDYSSPNIAKPFSIGHLRSTIIGQVLYDIYKILGYNVIGDNHIGDWGTQFGKLIVAYLKWGDEKRLKSNPMKESLELYVRFHKEVDKDSKLEIDARGWFKKLESGDKKAEKIWKLFKNLSIGEFEKIYNLLNVKFDVTLGESFYKDKTDEIINECLDKGIAKWDFALDANGKINKSEKVLIINLENYGINTPLLLKKSDGTTLYATRDLAAIKYRIKKWHPDKILYVVGSEQKLYFKQLFKVAELLGYKTTLEHIDFGLIRLPEGKLSTRAGRVIFLEDVIKESISKVKDVIGKKITGREKDEISKIVGIGAIKYADLSQSRIKDIVFDWNKIVTLKGNSGPYLQYQYVRIISILKKAETPDNKIKVAKIKPELLNSQEEIKLIKTIAKFNDALKKVTINFETHILTDYLFNLSELFSVFYEKHSVLKANSKDLKVSRLYLCQITSDILKKGLKLLSIDVPKKM